MYERRLSYGPPAPATPARPPGSPAYAVSFDPRNLKRHEAGVGPDGEPRVRYTIALAGQVDDRWRRSFRLVQVEETGYFRYRLEMASWTIAFTCAESQAEAELATSLKQIGILLGLVNRAASLAD